MRRHAKASTAGSTMRRAGRLGRIFRGAAATRGDSLQAKGSGAPAAGGLVLSLCALAGMLAILAFAAAPASAAVPAIAATWSEDVVFTEATLKAEINPEGKATTYHFEYGTTEAYGSETPEIAVGSDSSKHKVSRFLSGLSPATTYHYRAVATNADGENEGPDRTFTTYQPFLADTSCPNQLFRYGPAAKLPDCRAYEMVSPVDKAGFGIEHIEESGTADYRSSLSGESFAYPSHGAFGDSVSASYTNHFLATRRTEGWSSHGVSPPQGTTIFDPEFTLDSLNLLLDTFTPDLASAWFMDYNATPIAPGGQEDFGNFYRRDNITDTYEAVAATVPPGSYIPEVNGYTDDGSHVFFNVGKALTPDAAPTTKAQIYEFSGGQLELISILPNGEANPEYSHVGTGNHAPSAGSTPEAAAVDNAVSEDGSRVFWTSGPQDSGLPGQIFVRIDGATTVKVSESVTTEKAQFWSASANGSKALFSFEEGPLADKLYEFDVDSETPTLIAGDVDGVAGAADDLSYVYFGSAEDLDAGATAGERNLYVRHEGAIEFIATLHVSDTNTSPIPSTHPARATADGRHLLFTSRANLTGYDNTDAVTGKPDLELFIYDAEADEVTCVSCNPSGTRPVGGSDDLASDMAAFVPRWQDSLNELRPISEDGNRVFFNAFDSLVPQDTNGVQDVYQWEAPGSGTCKVGGSSHSPQNDGCVSLISTGQSAEKSEFTDADPDGGNVFFTTESSIHPDDPGLVDLYVARVNGGYPLPPEPTPCVGDACQSIPAAPADPTPASASFKGAGDPLPRRSCGATAKRAAKLSRQAKQLRRKAKRASSAKQGKRLNRRSAQSAKQAKRLSKTATRCRRANRRAAR